MRKELPAEFYKELNANSLLYKSTTSNYQSCYSIYANAGNNILKVDCSGRMEVSDLKQEFGIMDYIVSTALKYNPEVSFIVKYDSRQLLVPSFKIRKEFLNKIQKLFAAGHIEHVAYIEHRKSVLILSRLFITFITGMSYSLHQDETSADLTINSYCATLEKESIDNQYNRSSLQNSITFPGWSYSSKKDKYAIRVALLSNKIVYSKSKGVLDNTTIIETYKILHQVLEFNGGNADCGIIDMSDVKYVSRKARKTFEYEALRISKKWKMCYCILPSYAKTLFRLYSFFNPDIMSQIQVVNSFEEAIAHSEGINEELPVVDTEENIDNLSYQELKEKYLETKKTLDTVKEKQTARIAELTKTFGSITWNKHFIPTKPDIDPDDEFYDLFETSWILQNDINEIMSEQKHLNTLLSNKVNEQNEALTHTENNLRNIINNSDKLIFLVDRKQNLVEANTNFHAFIKDVYNVKFEIGENLNDKLAIYPNILNKWNKWFKIALTGRSPFYVENLSINGLELIYEFRLFPVFEDGKITGVSVRAFDITTQKNFERQLQNHNKELQKVNSELDQFVYSVSHDLRAPLTSLMGLIEISKLEQDPAAIKQYVHLQERSVKKLDNFIQDIIHLSRNSRTEVKFEEIDCNSFFKDIISDFQFMSQAEMIEKHITINQVEPLYGDKSRLKIIFSNLISNAIRYADLRKNNPYFKITASINSTCAEIIIEDNGQGIKDEYQEKIFDMFYRANTEKNGSGLGLYILKESLKKINGSISVQSVYGKGSSFTINFPNKIPEGDLIRR
ncbi:MAG: hypothetical protein CMO01_25340 [Thalassobius sp.]|nr:hypothetical protein [Thalassovita sp.]